MVHRETFEPDGGFRLFNGERSLLLRSLSIGERLPVRLKSKYSLNILNYLEATLGHEPTRRSSTKGLKPSDFPRVRTPSFFRFADDQTMAFLMEGSFRLGTPQYYRTLDDPGRADLMEGYATIFLEGKKKSFNLTATSGFNCAVLCGIARLPSEPHRLKKLREQFGPNLLEITDANAFCETIASKIGSIRHQIKDVRYADAKYMSIKTDDMEEYQSLFGSGDLTGEKIHQMNLLYWEVFYERLLLASVFSKPLAFSGERERRIAFELPRDVAEPFITVDAPDALKFIRFR